MADSTAPQAARPATHGSRTTAPAPRPLRRFLPHAVIAAVLLAAAWLLLGGLGEAGLWTRGELPILDRTLAALGEPRSNLERSPWLPDALRTWAYQASGRRDLGLRLPGALAGLGLVALTMVTAWRLGWSLAWIALAGGFALATPLLLASSRTALGNPTGELWASAAAFALIGAVDRNTPKLAARLALAGLGLACLAAAVASLGIVLGGCLPLTWVALAEVAREPEHGELAVPRWASLVAAGGAAATGFVGLWLARNQAEGYIPLLAAAKDLALLDDPSAWSFTDAFERLGYQLFPFTGLVVIGLLGPGRARWPALWLGVAVVFASLWSLRYPATPAPVTIPAALLATSACQKLVDPHEPIAARRLILAAAILAALVLGKDAGWMPQRIASPLLSIPGPEFPDYARAGLDPGADPRELLPRMAKRFAAALLLIHVLAPPSRDQLRWRARRETPWWLRQWAVVATILDRLLTGAGESSGLARARRYGPLLVLAGLLGAQAWGYGRSLLGELDQQMSAAGPLRRHAAELEAGTLPASVSTAGLGVHRVRDPGLRHYWNGAAGGDGAGGPQVFLPSRGDLDVWLAAPEPRVALIQRRDLPAAFTAARMQARPLFVLDAAHHDYLRVANFSPAGVEDQNPLADIIVAEPPALAHPTRVVWDPYVELIGWQLDGALHRGAKVTMHLAFRVKRPLPAGTQLFARLQRGKTSRVSAAPVELTGGLLPPNYWRAGDIIHHRHVIEAPWLEVLPGEHELIVGLRRSEKTNLKITEPAEGTGEHGVALRGKTHEFAVIGVAELAW